MTEREKKQIYEMNKSGLNGDLFPLQNNKKALIISEEKYSNELLLQVLALIRWDFPLDQIFLSIDSEMEKNLNVIFLKNLNINNKKLNFLIYPSLAEVDKIFNNDSPESLFMSIMKKEVSLDFLFEEINNLPNNYNILLYYNTEKNLNLTNKKLRLYHLNSPLDSKIKHDTLPELVFLDKLDSDWAQEFKDHLLNNFQRACPVEQLTDSFVSLLFEKEVIVPLVAIDINNIYDETKLNLRTTFQENPNKPWFGLTFFVVFMTCLIIAFTLFYCIQMSLFTNPSLFTSIIGNRANTTKI